MTIRAEPLPETMVLRVDATVHAAEVARFTRFVVRRPGPRDCWLWVGAIADDGYGRLWLNRNGHKRVVRPPRYALALALARGLVLGEHHIVMHEVCDLPLCVRAETVGGHLEVGTQAQNLDQMSRAGRGGGRGWRTAGTASTPRSGPPAPAPCVTRSATGGTRRRSEKR